MCVRIDSHNKMKLGLIKYEISVLLFSDVRENPNISMDIQRNLQMTGKTIQLALDKLHQYFDKETLN